MDWKGGFVCGGIPMLKGYREGRVCSSGSVSESAGMTSFGVRGVGISPSKVTAVRFWMLIF